MDVVQENVQHNEVKTLRGLNETNLVSFLQQNIISTANAAEALNKLLSQHLIIPKYELAALVDGLNPNRTYLYSVSLKNVGDQEKDQGLLATAANELGNSVIGSGTSKKKAKNSAAYKFLHEIAGVPMNNEN